MGPKKERKGQREKWHSPGKLFAISLQISVGNNSILIPLLCFLFFFFFSASLWLHPCWNLCFCFPFPELILPLKSQQIDFHHTFQSPTTEPSPKHICLIFLIVTVQHMINPKAHQQALKSQKTKDIQGSLLFFPFLCQLFILFSWPTTCQSWKPTHRRV